jgi:hypothetical protein
MAINPTLVLRTKPSGSADRVTQKLDRRVERLAYLSACKMGVVRLLLRCEMP